jgi:hypothetical protein
MPTMEQCAGWVRTPYNDLGEQLFVKSFTGTFLTTELDELHMIRHNCEDLANAINLISTMAIPKNPHTRRL